MTSPRRRQLVATLIASAMAASGAVRADPLILEIPPEATSTNAPGPGPLETSTRPRGPKGPPLRDLTPEEIVHLRGSWEKVLEELGEQTRARFHAAIVGTWIRGIAAFAAGQIRTEEDAKRAFFPDGCQFSEDESLRLSQAMTEWANRELLPLMDLAYDPVRDAPGTRPAGASGSSPRIVFGRDMRAEIRRRGGGERAAQDFLDRERAREAARAAAVPPPATPGPRFEPRLDGTGGALILEVEPREGPPRGR